MVMKNLLKALFLTLAMLLVACTTLNHPPPALGITEGELLARSGAPTARYRDGKGNLLEYSSPWAQYTYMARIGADNRLKSWEQVLTTEKFATVKVGQTTKAQVLLTFGKPAETTYLSLPDLLVWSYRYKEGGVWNSMMHVHFDQAGIVRMMQNGPDPMFDTSSDRGRGGRR
jgi:hypothetical protein